MPTGPVLGSYEVDCCHTPRRLAGGGWSVTANGSGATIAGHMRMQAYGREWGLEDSRWSSLGGRHDKEAEGPFLATAWRSI